MHHARGLEILGGGVGGTFLGSACCPSPFPFSSASAFPIDLEPDSLRMRHARGLTDTFAHAPCAGREGKRENDKELALGPTFVLADLTMRHSARCPSLLPFTPAGPPRERVARPGQGGAQKVASG